MFIRRAEQADAPIIVKHLLLAMEEIVFQFIHSTSKDEAAFFLEGLVTTKNNQYSYENCWVVEYEGKVVATALIYDGSELITLRKPVARRIKKLYGLEFCPENETQAGEYYLDCLAVDADFQGKGIGKFLISYLIEEYNLIKHQNIGLLVELENQHAKKLYLNMGFQVVGEKLLAGKILEHLQINYR